MNRKTALALTLTAALTLTLQGCAHTNLNGDPMPSTGQDVAKAIVGLVIVGGLLYAASKAAGSEPTPDETYTTTCAGNSCTTEVYKRD